MIKAQYEKVEITGREDYILAEFASICKSMIEHFDISKIQKTLEFSSMAVKDKRVSKIFADLASAIEAEEEKNTNEDAEEPSIDEIIKDFVEDLKKENCPTYLIPVIVLGGIERTAKDKGLKELPNSVKEIIADKVLAILKGDEDEHSSSKQE